MEAGTGTRHSSRHPYHDEWQSRHFRQASDWVLRSGPVFRRVGPRRGQGRQVADHHRIPLPAAAARAALGSTSANLFGVYLAVFLLTQALCKPEYFRGDYLTAPPNLDATVDFSAFAGISGLSHITTDERGFRVSGPSTTRTVRLIESTRSAARRHGRSTSTTERPGPTGSRKPCPPRCVRTSRW